MAEVVVIGAGMGALAAAGRLAVSGHRVRVYERGDAVGGSAAGYERDGFSFDTGPGLLQLPAVWRDFFVKTGRETLEQCVRAYQVDPASRHLFTDGTEVILPAASRAKVIEALDAALGPGSGERWTDLVSRARTVWDASRRPLLEEPATDGPAELADPYPVRRRGLLRRRARTLEQVAHQELSDPRLVALLGSYARAHGLEPAEAPAGATMLAYLEQTFGSWYVVGGMGALTEAVHQRCLERGVRFHFGSEVRGVTADQGVVTGVELADGTTVPADVVVDGGGWHAAQEQVPALGGSSRHTLLLALRGSRPAEATHLNVVHTDSGIVTVSRPDDPTLVPDAAHEAVVVSTPVPAGSSPGADAVAALLAVAERAVPHLSERLLWHEERTPADYGRQTGAPGGAIPAPALAGGANSHLSGNLSTPRGTYRVGGWAHPGGGLPHAGMSGALAAGLIVEGDDWRGSR